MLELRKRVDYGGCDHLAHGNSPSSVYCQYKISKFREYVKHEPNLIYEKAAELNKTIDDVSDAMGYKPVANPLEMRCQLWYQEFVKEAKNNTNEVMTSEKKVLDKCPYHKPLEYETILEEKRRELI
jgi:hypothetical protein